MVEEDKHWVVVMPRLLIGLCLLFWAVMSEKLFIGVALAVLIEGYWLIKIKWNFSYANFVKSWYLCIICGFFITFMYWVDGASIKEFRKVFEWMPVIFFPIVFTQRYSVKDSMPMNTFFLIARKRMNADIREKRVTQPWMINVTLPYFLIVLLSAGLLNRSNDFYGFFHLDVMSFYCYGVATLLGCFIFLIGKRNGRSMAKFIIPYGLMMLTATFLLSKLHQLESVIKGTDMVDNYNPNLDQVITKIGALEEIKNTKKVQWRMWVPDDAKVPSMIPMTIFNLYRRGTWGAVYSKKFKSASKFEKAVLIDVGENIRQSFSNNRNLVSVTKKEGAYRFLSTMSQNSTEIVVPHLKGYFAYDGLVGDEAYIERSRLGSVLIGNPDSTLQCFMWRDELGSGPVSSPIKSVDRSIPDIEKKAIAEVVDKLGLRELSDAEKVSTLQGYFIREFNYTKHLKSGDVNQGLNSKLSALSYFLQVSKTGHCEYFATAGTLILREAGVNARYINGFVVKKGERIDDAYALRGDQVHAWTQMWDGEQWLDADFTPPDWLAKDTHETSFSEKLSDWWKLAKEDFQVWRNDPENADKILYGIYTSVAVLVLWILGRLFFAKNKVKDDKEGYGELPSLKALKKFNKWSQKKLGRRQTGIPYATWIKELKHQLPMESDVLVCEYSELYSTMKFAELESDEESISQLSILAKKIMQSDKKQK